MKSSWSPREDSYQSPLVQVVETFPWMKTGQTRDDGSVSNQVLGPESTSHGRPISDASAQLFQGSALSLSLICVSWFPSQPLPLASPFLHPFVSFWLGKTCPSISFSPSLRILLSFFLPVLVLCSFMIGWCALAQNPVPSLNLHWSSDFSKNLGGNHTILLYHL